MNVLDFIVKPFRPKEVTQPRTDFAQSLTEPTQIIKLSHEDQMIISQALENPPEPNETLRQAFKRYFPMV